MRPTLPMLTSSTTAAISQPFKRAQTGLFQGKLIRYGNNVPFSHKKTRRSWLPNVQHKRLASALGDAEREEGLVRVKVTTRALRTIKKVGGLDTYLKTAPPNLLGSQGMQLRLRLLEQERQAKGLPTRSYQLQTDKEYQASKAQSKVEAKRSKVVEAFRARVAEKLGKEGLATQAETIAWLEQQRDERAMLSSSS